MATDTSEHFVLTGPGPFLYPELVRNPSAILHSMRSMIILQGETESGVTIYLPVSFPSLKPLTDALSDPMPWPKEVPSPDNLINVELSGPGPFELPQIIGVEPPAFQRGQTILTPCMVASDTPARALLRIAVPAVQGILLLLRNIPATDAGVQIQEFAQTPLFSDKEQ